MKEKRLVNEFLMDQLEAWARVREVWLSALGQPLIADKMRPPINKAVKIMDFISLMLQEGCSTISMFWISPLNTGSYARFIPGAPPNTLFFTNKINTLGVRSAY